MSLLAYVCGYGAASNVSSMTIPFSADVPRTDPTGGATLILVIGGTEIGGHIVSISDDATAEDDYSFCLFDDGLNHYGVGQNPGLGLIANDLANGVNNLNLGFDTTLGFAQLALVALTGVDLSTTGAAPLFDPTMPRSFCDHFVQDTEYPIGGGTSFAAGVAWSYNSGGLPQWVPGAPSGATDAGWDWITGDLAFYIIPAAADSSPLGPWLWADGSLTDFDQFEDVDSSGFYHDIVIATQTITPGVAGPSLAGAWTGGQNPNLMAGYAYGYISGGGPSCTTPPPTNSPVFNHWMRVGD